MTKSLVRLGVTCLSFGILACESDPEQVQISSAQAALTASENSERALDGLIDAADFLAESTAIAETLNAIGGGSQECDSVGVFCAGDQGSCPPPEAICTSTPVSAADLEQSRTEIRESAKDLVRELRERILIPENLEAETPTSATYRLSAAVLCPEDDTPSNGLAADPIPLELDSDCVDRVERLSPRLVLASPREGDIDVTLLLGAARHAPASLQLYQGSLGVRIDLGEALGVARELGEELEGVSDLEGVLELRLVENQPRDYSLELNVKEPLRLLVDADGDTLSATLAKSSPTWNVRVDGNAKTVSAGLDLGALQLLGPLGLFADLFEGGSAELSAAEPPPERSYTGVMEVFLAGLSGTLRYAGDGDVLELLDLGFGDSTSTLKHDGHTLMSLDLNALQGRRVNVVVNAQGESGQLSITPTLDLSLSFAFDYVADQFEDVADYLLHDTLRVWLGGDAPVLELADERVKVISGTLNLESAAAPGSNISVGAGMCLVTSEDEDGTAAEAGTDAAHPFDVFSAVSCE